MALLPEGQTCFSKFSGRNKLNFLAFLIICGLLFSALSLTGCDWLLEDTEENNNNGDDNGEPIFYPDIVFPKITHYGANLGYFPPNARDWIMNTGFTKEKMEQYYMIDPALKVWWSDDNNAILFEASYTMAAGYVGAGTRKTWGEGARYGGSSNIFDTYGEHATYRTLRYRYEHKLDVERQLKNDPVFAEIIEFAKRLCAEIEYDWASFDGYPGPVKKTPGQRYHTCGGYANEVMEKALNVNSVMSVQMWTSPGHAWNVLKLVDGRTLYFDLTWFDNEHINSETGEIYQTDDYDWENITFYEHLFRFSNVGYGTKVFHHDIGALNREIGK
jgi:hypothetical protein